MQERNLLSVRTQRLGAKFAPVGCCRVDHLLALRIPDANAFVSRVPRQVVAVPRDADCVPGSLQAQFALIGPVRARCASARSRRERRSCPEASACVSPSIPGDRYADGRRDDDDGGGEKARDQEQPATAGSHS